MENENVEEVQQQSEGETAQTVRLADDQLQELEAAIADAGADSAAAVSLAVTDSIGGLAARSGTSGVVLLDDSQFGTLTSFAGANLHTSVFAAAFLALILGAVVGVALTLHWRGSRG